jgi:D-xylose transport system permease protein
MTQATIAKPELPTGRQARSITSLLQSMEIDTRLLGMIFALAIIWVVFNVMSGGIFLSPRNLWYLSVQSAAVAVMACGMVLVIVSRNIDLSVGSIVGLTGYVMAMVQAVWIPTTLKLGFDQPYTWFVALAVGLLLGAAIGAFQGLIVAYGKVPSFIVTLGGMLVWRGLVFEIQQGQTISPLDKTFDIIGGGLPNGAIGSVPSLALGIVGCVLIVYAMVSSRRKRAGYGFPVRPVWALVAVTAAGCIAILGAVWVVNSYMWPAGLATAYALAHGITEPPGGLQIPVGIAAPVLIVLGVTLGVTFLATRRKFGRYVFAIGGNPEAAELGGINTKATILKTFTLMGILSAVSGAIYAARLDSGVTSLGTGDELAVIAAAVIGGTSFAGGIGTIPGAVMGAVVMQSLRSGMILLKFDSPVQDIVVGAVLVAAVGLDVFLHRRRAS